MSNEFFMVRFSDEEDYKFALFEGPWHMFDHYLLVQRWRPLFDTSDHKIQKIAVWIRIPNLPMELYNSHFFLWRVGLKLGTMMKIDNLTSVQTRGDFARICVKIDLQRELVPTFSALGRDFNLEYEGLHLICFGCGKYSHRISNCVEVIPKNSVNVVEKDGNQDTLERVLVAATEERSQGDQLSSPQILQIGNQNPEIIGQKEGSVFGPWMIAKKTVRRNKFGVRYEGSNQIGKDLEHNIVNESGKLNASGSRFDIFEKQHM